MEVVFEKIDLFLEELSNDDQLYYRNRLMDIKNALVIALIKEKENEIDKLTYDLKIKEKENEIDKRMDDLKFESFINGLSKEGGL